MTSALPDIYKRTWHTFLLYVVVDVISKKKGEKRPHGNDLALLYYNDHALHMCLVIVMSSVVGEQKQ